VRYAVWIDCYRCDGQIEVEVEVTPGEEPVYYPSRRAHPGSPAEVEIVGETDRFGCDCDLDFGRLEEERRDRLLERAGEAMIAAREFAAERKMEEERDRRLERGGF